MITKAGGRALRTGARRDFPLRSLLAAFILLSLAPLPRAAWASPSHQRFAISIAPGESPYQAAAAFELACLRVNQKVRRVWPVQLFELADRSFVRLEVEAEQPHLCFQGLPPSRQGVDGSFQWFDGFEGGLLIRGSSPPDPALDNATSIENGFASPHSSKAQPPPSLPPSPLPDSSTTPAQPASPELDPLGLKPEGEARFEPADETRVPDEIWFAPGSKLPKPVLASEFNTALAQGSQQAIEKLQDLSHSEQWSALEGLLVRQGARVQVALERIVASDAPWNLRRAALMGLDPKLAWEAVLKAAKDPHPGMRLSALPYLSYYEEGLVAGALGDREKAWKVLAEIFQSDPSWSVRRAVLFSLSIAQARRHSSLLKKRLSSESSDLVAAAVLEILDAAGELGRGEVRGLIDDSRRAVHLAAISALLRHMVAQDAPLLWEKFTSPIPEEAHAAVGLLHLIEDDSIRSSLWPLYIREAERLDANPWYLETMLDYIQRHPPPEAPELLRQRLNSPTSPIEHRLLARTLATLAPAEAEALFLPDLASSIADERSLAADVLPNSAQVRKRRLEIIDSDPDSDVRAAALIGLCRVQGQEPGNLLSRAMLLPSPLASEAMSMFQRCGKPPLQFRRFKTQLLSSEATPVQGFISWPLLALAACLLLLGSVLGEKLKKPRKEQV